MPPRVTGNYFCFLSWSVLLGLDDKMRSDNEVKVTIYGIRTSLMVQWLRLPTSYVGVAGSIPGWGIKIPHAVGHSQKRGKKGKEKNGRSTLIKKKIYRISSSS